MIWFFIVAWVGIIFAIVNMYVIQSQMQKRRKKFSYTRLDVEKNTKTKYSEYYNSFKNVLLKRQPITLDNRYVCSLVNESRFAVYDIDTKNIVEMDLTELNFSKVLENGI